MEEILTMVGVLIQDLEPLQREAEALTEACNDARLKLYNQGKADSFILSLAKLRKLYGAIHRRIENTKPR